MPLVAAGIIAALPGELHLDAVVAVGLHRGAVADHDGALGAVHGGFRVQAQAVTVEGLRAVRQACGNRSEGVAVEAGRVFAGSAIGGSVGLPTLTDRKSTR